MLSRFSECHASVMQVVMNRVKFWRRTEKIVVSNPIRGASLLFVSELNHVRTFGSRAKNALFYNLLKLG